MLVQFGYPAALWYFYNPSLDTWTQTGGAGYTPRNIASTATLIEGPDCVSGCQKVVWAGGNDNLLATPDPVHDLQSQRADLYDPLTGVFTPTADMHIPRGDHSAVSLHDGKVLVLGGDRKMPQYSYEIYNPATATWSLAKNLPQPLGTPSRVTVLADGRVLALGEYQNVASVYDPAVDSWTDPALCDCLNNTVTLLKSEKVLGSVGTRSRVYVAGPRGTPGTWTEGPSKAEREAHAALLLENGQVLLVGGNAPADATAELYIPPA